MLALTSLSPSHRNADVQKDCIQSWIDAGFKPVSLNHPDEIEGLREQYDNIRLIPTRSTMEATFGKPYVRVSALIDYAKDQDAEHCLLVNSDIKIIDESGITGKLLQWSEKGLVFIHRHDYETDINKAVRYDQGMDGFIIHKKHLNVFPQSLLCLGACHWDYILPYQAQKAGLPIKRIVERYLFHKAHPVQYSKESWELTAQISRTECGLWGHFKPGGISAVMYQQIMRQAQKQGLGI